MLDTELRLRRFTPAAGALLGLTEADLGRPLARLAPHLAPHLAPRLGDGDPVSAARDVLAIRAPLEQLVFRPTTGDWYAMGVLPHETLDGRVDGVILAWADITELRATQERNAQLAAIVESAQEAIIGKTLEGVITSWNPGAQTIYGYTPEEAVGRGIDLIVPRERRGELAAIHARLARGERVEPFETEGVDKEGRRLRVVLAISPVRDAQGGVVGASAIAHDVTRRVEAEEALRASEQQLRLITDSLPVLLAYVDADGIYRSCNRTYESWFGLSREAVVGRHLRGVLGDHAYRAIRPRVERVLAGEMVSFEERLAYARGAPRDVHVDYIPDRGPDGAVAGFFALIRDVGEQKRSEADLIRARRDAERANAAKDRFLALLSHELRTPLTPVLTAVQGLQEEPGLGPEARDLVERIRRNVELEARLIDDLLDVTRIESGRFALHLERVAVDEVVHAALEICAPEAGDGRVEVDFPAHPLPVRVDRTRMMQVFWNLLRNALRATPADGRIRVVGREAVHRDRPVVVVEVRHRGQGIASGDLTRIFEAFAQSQRGGRWDGMGLGPYLARSIAVLHGGGLEAESAGEEQGATFRLWLPRDGAPPPAASESPPGAGANGDRKRRSILLVEDHADTGYALALLLRRRGYRVETAPDVADARRRLAAGGFDLLISDLRLPDGDGLDLMREVRQRWPEIQGVATSGFGSAEDVAASLEAGFREHLTKPVTLETVLRAIDAAGARGDPQ